MRRRYAGVEALTEGFAGVQNLECLVQGIQQVSAGRLVLVQAVGDSQRNTRRSDEIASGLVDLHDSAWAHEELSVRLHALEAAQAGPAMEGQEMRSPISPLWR